jgi:hypothetical protein
MLVDTLKNTITILTEHHFLLETKNYILDRLDFIEKTDKDLYNYVLGVLDNIEKQLSL